jgi:hypothetical protein
VPPVLLLLVAVVVFVVAVQVGSAIGAAVASLIPGLALRDARAVMVFDELPGRAARGDAR